MRDEKTNSAGDSLVARLEKLETGLVSDVLDEAGLPNQVVSSSLSALVTGVRFAGRAACVSGEPFIASRNPVSALASDTLESVVGDESVLVIGTGGFSAGSVLGGFVAFSLQREGCRGVITDGAIRDAAEIRELGLPVVAASVIPTNGAHRWRLTRRDVPVLLPGQTGAPVSVEPMDLILADADGVVVIPSDCAEQIIADAEELARIEQKIGAELRSGGRRTDVMASNPRFVHVRKVTRK